MNPPRPDPVDPLRFTIASDTRGDVDHVVDLGAFEGLGECSCEDCQINYVPRLLEGERASYLRCKHVLRARASFADRMIALILKSTPRENED